MSIIDRIHLKNASLPQLHETIQKLGEPRFRARQVVKWLYQKRIGRFDEMSNVSKATQSKLNEYCSIEKLPIHSILKSRSGDAVKFGFIVPDSSMVIESVLLYDGKRRTACISSQLGCGLGCTFCETARLGLIRNLTQEEIIGQLIGINDYLESQGDKVVTNIVFMGMGEALSNFCNFITSLGIIMHEDGFNLGGRKITVSTAGVIPSIERLIQEGLNIGLAISLNAYSNEQRNVLMPINKKYPIEQLVDIAKKYFEKTGRRVTFEYIIIDGETNTPEALSSLQHLLGGFPCKVNLIPFNPTGDNTEKKGVSEQHVQAFADSLHKRGLAATIRKSRGTDIKGACGQLSAHILSSEKELL